MELDEIVERIREGKTGEFAELVVRYRDMAFGYALTLLDQEQMAEDAVQEALLIAYTRLDHLRRPQAFGAWLRGIVRHQCAHARRSGRPTLSWEQVGEVGSDEPDPADAALNAIVREQVRIAVAELPAAQREIVQLHYEAGLSQRDIATRLSLTVGAVNMRLHAARMRLRRRLQIMTDTAHETGNTGRINAGRVQEANGPVVTLQFAPAAPPPLFSRLTADGKEDLCVVQQLSAGRVRAVAGRATAIWTPGQEILDTGQPFTAPLDLATIRKAMDGIGMDGIGERRGEERQGRRDQDNPQSAGEASTPALLTSGIKTIDVFAPLTQGGCTGIFTEWGLGVLVLLPELLQRLEREDNRQTFCVFMPPIRDVAHWQEVTAEITAGHRNIAMLYLPVADPISQEFVDGISSLDTTLVLGRHLAELAIWPCLDPVACRSHHTVRPDEEAAAVGTEVRRLLMQYFTLEFAVGGAARHTLSEQERQEIQRARKALRFLSQPFFVAEPYTGRPGVSVPAEEALRGFSGIVSGHYDSLSRDEFYMIGAAPTA